MYREGDVEKRNNTYSDLGVAFSVEGKVAEEAKRLLNAVAQKADLEYGLDSASIPHVSVFQGRFPLGAELKVQEILKSLISSGSELTGMHMQDHLDVRPDGKVFWNLQPNKELQTIHNKLNSALRPLTQDMIMDQFQNRLKNPLLDPQERERILKYGFALAGEAFLPHITLGKLRRIEDARSVMEIEPAALSINLQKMFIGHLGNEGQMNQSDFGAG